MIVMGAVLKFNIDSKSTTGQANQIAKPYNQPIKTPVKATTSNMAGAAGKVMAVPQTTPIKSYDFAFFGNQSNNLEMYESLGTVKGTFGSYEIPLLRQRQIIVHGQPVTYYQLLHFNFLDADGYWSHSGSVVYAKNRQQIPADYLYFTLGQYLYQYEVSFAGDMSSNISNTTLVDFSGLRFNILGEDARLMSASLYGTTLTLRFQYANPAFGIVEFSDANYADDNYYQGVQINGEVIADARVRLRGQIYQGRLLLTEIDYQVKANAAEGSKIYVPQNGLLSTQMEHPKALLSSKYDLIFSGMPTVSTALIEFNPQGDDAYNLKFKNTEGLMYNLPFVDTSYGYFHVGSDTEDLWFEEFDNNIYQISEDDYIVFTSEQYDITHVVQYDGIDTMNSKLLFTDLATGQKEVSYMGDPTIPGSAHGQLVIGGATFLIGVYGDEMQGYNLTADLNADGLINYGTVGFSVLGGGKITAERTAYDRIHMSVMTPEEKIESMSQDLHITWDFVSLAPGYDQLAIQGIVADDGHFQLESDASGNLFGRDVYGTLVTVYNSQESAKRLTLNYPKSQIFPRVAIRTLKLTATE
jgi:hypothetical protein